MTEQPPTESGQPKDQNTSSLLAWLRRLASEMALQDWIVLVYVWVLLVVLLICAESSEAKTTMLGRIGALVVTTTAVLVAVRGSLLSRPTLSSLLYRTTIYGVVQVSYFMLKGLLPLVNDRALDAQLYQFDLHAFGFEPSETMDKFVNLYTTEWFAFFYYGYFFVLGLHILPFLFLSRRNKLFAEFALGLFSAYCISHVIYMIVPGFGPYRYLTAHFQHPLVPGFWMQRVLDAVNSAGAQKDIFPSLHTAGPTFIFLFSFRHRKEMPFRFTWPLVGFFAINIVAATMFLRWHYLIDVVAGIAVATGLSVLAARVSPREVARRETRGLQAVWPPLWSARTALQPAPARSLPSAGQ